MAAKCFDRCITATNTRLTEGTDEFKCLTNCVNTHVETNHRTVKNYTLSQEEFMKKTQDYENDKMKHYVEQGILDETTLELKPIRPKSPQEMEIEMVESFSPRIGSFYRWYLDVPAEESAKS